jgi:hypothetical protein
VTRIGKPFCKFLKKGDGESAVVETQAEPDEPAFKAALETVEVVAGIVTFERAFETALKIRKRIMGQINEDGNRDSERLNSFRRSLL